jgi:hypothetical protein
VLWPDRLSSSTVKLVPATPLLLEEELELLLDEELELELEELLEEDELLVPPQPE